MPELEYNLSTGIDQNNLLNLRIDTQERMDYINNYQLPSYIPPKEFIPKHFESDDIIQGNYKLPTIDEALASDNKSIRDAAKAEVYNKMKKDPKMIGWGVGRSLPYVEGQDRYTKDAFYKEKQYTMYGYNPYISLAENEDWLHNQTWENYSFGGKLWRGVGTFAGRVLSKLVTGLVGTAGDLGAITWNGLQEFGDLINLTDGKNNFWADVSNNWLSRKMTELDEHVRDQWLPTYKALNYDQKGAWEKLFDPYTWQTSFADGVGFLLQFAVPGTVFGKLASAGKLARGIGNISTIAELEKAGIKGMELAARLEKAGMTIEQAKNAGKLSRFMGLEIPNTTRFGRVAGSISETLTGSKDVGGISAHLFNTSMEAVVETKSGFDDTVNNLMKNGMSREDAEKIASENAPTQFWLNVGILSVSNAFENKLLQKAIGNRIDKNRFRIGSAGEVIENTPTTKFGKFLDKTFGEKNKWGNRIKFYGKNATYATWWEGYWEENAQTAAQRAAAGEYTRYGDDTSENGKKEKSNGFWRQYIKQTIDAAKGNDREAADSIMAGAVIGILGATTFAKMSGDRKNEISDRARIVANYKNTRDAFLSLSVMPHDLYTKDGKIDMEKAKKRAEEINEKLLQIDSTFRRTITAEELTDPNEREGLQHLAFADYVKAHILNGTEEQLLDRLSNWGNKSPGELAVYGVTEELQKNSSYWSTLAKDLIDKYNEIKDIKFSAEGSELAKKSDKNSKEQTYFDKSNAVKSIIYDYTARKFMSDRLAANYRDLKDSVNPFSKFKDQQLYNEKQAEILALKNQVEREQVPFTKEKLQQKLDELQKEQLERKKVLLENGNSVEDGTTFMFPKDVKDKEKEINISDVNDFLEYQWNQSFHENASKQYGILIDDYSKPSLGIHKWNQTVDFWEARKKDEDEKIKKEAENKEIKENLETLNKQKEELETNLSNAKTKEERDSIKNQLDEINAKINDIKNSSTPAEDPVDEKSLEELNKDVSSTPVETQYGVVDKDYDSDSLAWVTRFKTVNSETRDVTTETGEKITWKEEVLEHSYDHDLSMFVEEFSKNSDKYDVFIIADTEELLKERLSKKQYEAFIANKGELGAIVVFKEKGKKEFVRFTNRENSPIVAYSFDEKAFDYKIGERAIILSNKSGINVEKALEIYAEQEATAGRLRAQALANPSVEIPVNASLGSLGIFPNTGDSYSIALDRFGEYVDSQNPFEVVKDVNNYPKNIGVSSGSVVMRIPGKKNRSKNTDTGTDFFIPVYPGNLSTGKEDINKRLYNAVQGVMMHKFNTKEEAYNIIQNFLKNIFYTSEKQYFKIKEEGGKFKIVYYRKDKNGREVNIPSFSTIRIKFSDNLYQNVKKFIIYEKDSATNKFIPVELSNQEYKIFIHASLETNRKLLVIDKNGKNLLYTKKVNAYLNLEEKPAEFSNKSGEETPPAGEETPPENTIDNLSNIIKEKKEFLEKFKETLKTNIEKAISENIRKILKKDGDKRIKQLEEEIENLEKLLPNKNEEQSTIQKLRSEAAFTTPIPDVSPIVKIRAGRAVIQFDFDKNTITSAVVIDENRAEKIKDSLEKANSLTIKEIKINQNSVYLVKYDKLGKFVVTNNLFKVIPITKEIENNEEYKNFKECK